MRPASAPCCLFSRMCLNYVSFVLVLRVDSDDSLDVYLTVF